MNEEYSRLEKQASQNEIKVNIELETPIKLDSQLHPDLHPNLLIPSKPLEIKSYKEYPGDFTQIKALLTKTINLQSRQIGTNVCQILTPLICLTLILVIQKVAESVIPGSVYSMPIPIIFNIPTFFSFFQSNLLPVSISNCLQWYYYGFDDQTDQKTKDYIGYNENLDFNNPLFKSGLLSNVVNNYACHYDRYNTSEGTSYIPYFKLAPNDSTINKEIYKELTFLNSQPYRRFEDLMGLEILPDGAVKFYEANDKKLSFTLQINDLRIPEYHRNNGITKITYKSKEGGQSYPALTVADGQISLLDLMSRSYLHQLNSSVWLISGVQYMPMKDQDRSWLMRLLNITAASLFPLALSLLLPVFMYGIVLEKEERLLEIMKMNGMKMKNYWIVYFFFSFIIYCLMASVFMAFGYFLVDLSFFTKTSPKLLFLILLGWGLSQVSLSVFYQVFLVKSRTSTIAGYVISIFTTLTSVLINIAVYPVPYKMPFGMRLYPPLGFCRLIYLMSLACSNYECYRYFDSITDEMSECLLFLYVGAIFFFFFGIYLHEVIPQEYGIPKHPLFFLRYFAKIFYFFFKQENGGKYTNLKSAEHIEHKSQPDSFSIDVDSGDSDVVNEANFVAQIIQTMGNKSDEYPLVIRELKKVYASSEGRPRNIAVKNFSLAVKKGQIFGLLGPNGAGKTTLISMLTGLYKPDSGNAWISGYEINEEIQKVQMNLGICPQFDLLWPDLTVEEHLKFYAKLKGVSVYEETVKLDKAIKEVALEKFKKFKTSQLSGGMKRRLSIAIALVGDPKVVFLDEPTTGLDPENRRHLWDILVQSKGKRAVILTTHSMEEADVLCSRIGIITKGILRCLAPQVRLKALYGKGYHLSVNCYKEKYFEKKGETKKQMNENYKKVQVFIQQILPKATLLSSFNGNFNYQVPLEGLEVSNVFETLEGKKEELLISDWGISQSSLEDVFMKIVDTSYDKAE